MSQLNELSIAEYLQTHPDFFQRHQHLLDDLYVVSKQQGTLSLVEVQLERQRKRIQELEQELAILAKLANQEQEIFLALMPLQQQLSHCKNLKQGIQAINQWTKNWELKQSKILLFTDQWQKQQDLEDIHWVDRKAFEIIRLERFGLRRFYLGEMTNREKSLLFLPEELPIGSVACCLLGAETAQNATALLLFTAHDSRHFHNGQNTQFLKHLVSIVELHLLRWLVDFAV